MLPKSERLTKEDFASNKRPQVFFRGALFDVAHIQLASSKFACVTSKKTMKKAVDRNGVKRKIFQAIQATQKQNSFSYIVYPKKESNGAAYSQLYEEMKKVFDTLHLKKIEDRR